MNLLTFEQKLNTHLAIDKFSYDANFNGLQVEACSQVSKVAFAVSPTQNIIEQAISQGCDCLVTHHGLYWKKQQAVATGLLAKRLSQLIKGNISLLSYHLPLDCHQQLGNNSQIAKVLDISNPQPVISIEPEGLLYQGQIKGSKTQFFDKVRTNHLHSTHIYDFSDKDSDLKILWCSGAGADYMQEGSCDIFLTGEISERHYTIAQELKVSLIQAGHWASEIWGVKALAQWAQQELKLETIFINEFNPI